MFRRLTHCTGSTYVGHSFCAAQAQLCFLAALGRCLRSRPRPAAALRLLLLLLCCCCLSAAYTIKLEPVASRRGRPSSQQQRRPPYADRDDAHNSSAKKRSFAIRLLASSPLSPNPSPTRARGSRLNSRIPLAGTFLLRISCTPPGSVYPRHSATQPAPPLWLVQKRITTSSSTGDDGVVGPEEGTTSKSSSTPPDDDLLHDGSLAGSPSPGR